MAEKTWYMDKGDCPACGGKGTLVQLDDFYLKPYIGCRNRKPKCGFKGPVHPTVRQAVSNNRDEMKAIRWKAFVAQNGRRIAFRWWATGILSLTGAIVFASFGGFSDFFPAFFLLVIGVAWLQHFMPTSPAWVGVWILAAIISCCVVAYQHDQTYASHSKYRIGAIDMDGTRSYSTGSGTGSHHGGVREWLYGDHVTPLDENGRWRLTLLTLWFLTPIIVGCPARLVEEMLYGQVKLVPPS